MDTTSPLPAWMETPPLPSARAATRDLQLKQFEIAFEHILDRLCAGKFLASTVRDYPIELDYGRLLAWIRRDAERWRRYCEAQQIGAEIIASNLADPSIEEEREIPQDANLRRVNFEIGKWYLGVVDRKRFAETKQIEVNQQISITAALQQANGRLIEHEVRRLIDVDESEPRTE